MFRRGGNTNMNGIMSKVEDRQDYEIGGGAGIQADIKTIQSLGSSVRGNN